MSNHFPKHYKKMIQFGYFKNVLFLCFMFPVIVMGQDDIKIRQILEKSIQTMHFSCKSIDYTLKREWFSEEHRNMELSCKTLFEADSIRKLSMEYKAYTGPHNDTFPGYHIAHFFDLIADTSIIWCKDIGILYIDSYQKNKNSFTPLHIWDNNYFTGSQEYMNAYLKAAAIMDTMEADQRYVFGASKGLAEVNGKTCHVIENSIIFTDYGGGLSVRYPDFKEGEYFARFQYIYFYIDTSDYMMRKCITFMRTDEGDTIFYNRTELMHYTCNNFTDINIQPTHIRRIVSGFEGAKSVLLDLQGKAPNIKGIERNLRPFNLYKQKKQCYVINFMSTLPQWDGTCDYIMDFWRFILQKYNSPDIEFFYMYPNEKPETLMEKRDVNPVIIPDNRVIDDYLLISYPSCFILDKDFNIIFTGYYFNDADVQEIERILSSYQNHTKK